MGWLGKLFGRESSKEKAMKMETAAMEEHGKEVIKMARDPVCGMEIDEREAAGKSEYMGTTYYFCSPGCKKAFDEDPAKYTEGGGHEMAGHGSHNM